MQWYFYSKGKQVGPVSQEGLFQAAIEGQLAPDDYVWNTTMGEQWVEARTIPGLFATPPSPATGSVPPPLPGPESLVPALEPEVPWDPNQPIRLSCMDCAGRAWERTKQILFRPFDFGKWFALGFSAWLATLGEQSGGSFPSGGDWPKSAMEANGGDVNAVFQQMHAQFLAHAALIVSIGSVVLVCALVIGITVLWLRCRGKFMLLDNVVNDRTEIAYPWNHFKQHGDSLFVWSLGYSLVALAVVAILVVVAAFSIAQPLLHGHAFVTLLPTIGANAIVWILVTIFFAYVSVFLDQFVVPIMYAKDFTATEAWSAFLKLFGRHTSAFIWYGLCYLLWTIFIGLCVMAAILATCCLALCPLSLPYLSTVAVLPAIVFLRIWSLEYLAQFGPEWRVRPVAI